MLVSRGRERVRERASQKKSKMMRGGLSQNENRSFVRLVARTHTTRPHAVSNVVHISQISLNRNKTKKEQYASLTFFYVLFLSHH